MRKRQSEVINCKSIDVFMDSDEKASTFLTFNGKNNKKYNFELDIENVEFLMESLQDAIALKKK